MVFVTGGSEAVEVLPEARAAISCGARRDEPPALHRARTLLARQYAGCACRSRAFSSAGEPSKARCLMSRFCRPPMPIGPLPGRRLKRRARPAPRNWRMKSCASGPRRSRPSSSSRWSGAAGGCVPAPAGYAKRVREICDRYGVLLIADEVMCGAGRCGTWRALEADGVEPDIMAVAKGLGRGLSAAGRRHLFAQGGGCHSRRPWRADDRAYLHRPHGLLRGGRRRSEDRSPAKAWSSGCARMRRSSSK